MFHSLWAALDDLQKRYDIKDMGIISGGISYTESRRFIFELNTNLKRKKKYVTAIIYRHETGRYELVDYQC